MAAVADPALASRPAPARGRPAGRAALLALGALGGLAWAAGLRGAMALLAAADSTVTWSGTFGWILLPGVAVGALLGWAEHLRRSGGRPGWRWLALSPLLFGAVLFSDLGGWAQFLEDGIGGGALAVPLFGMLGGWALSARGPRWARVACRAVLLAPVPVLLVVLVRDASTVTALDAFVGLYFSVYLLALMVACAIPHRPVRAG
jgi:hypothetical protein